MCSFSATNYILHGNILVEGVEYISVNESHCLTKVTSCKGKFLCHFL